MDRALACQPRSCHAHWLLAPGRAVTVRAVLPEDLQLEADFVAHGLTPQSRYQRFQLGLRELPPGMAAYFTDIDYRRHVALLALAEQDGLPRQVGEARYIRDSDMSDRAEFALAVADDWQGLGLGTRLLRALLRVAREQGVGMLVGDMLRSNTAMLALARAQGFTPRPQGDARLVRMARVLEHTTAMRSSEAPAHAAARDRQPPAHALV